MTLKCLKKKRMPGKNRERTRKNCGRRKEFLSMQTGKTQGIEDTKIFGVNEKELFCSRKEVSFEKLQLGYNTDMETESGSSS